MRRTAWQLFVSIMVASSVGCVSPGDPTPAKAPPASTAVPPEPPRSAMAISADATYTIVAVAANKCLQVAGRSTDDNARAQIAPCDGSAAQQFRLQPVAGGYHTIVNVSSGKCFDVPAGSRDNGANVQQYSCGGGPNQQWIVADAPGGNVRFVARHSGKVIDVQGAVTTDFTGLIQWPWSGDPNQRFKLTPVVMSPPAEVAAKPEPGVGGAAGSKAKPGKVAKAPKAR